MSYTPPSTQWPMPPTALSGSATYHTQCPCHITHPVPMPPTTLSAHATYHTQFLSMPPTTPSAYATYHTNCPCPLPMAALVRKSAIIYLSAVVNLSAERHILTISLMLMPGN